MRQMMFKQWGLLEQVAELKHNSEQRVVNFVWTIWRFNRYWYHGFENYSWPTLFFALMDRCKNGEQLDFYLQNDSILCFQKRIFVTNNYGLREEFFKAYCSRYTIHHKNTKMHNNLRENYWWNYMENEIANFVSKCLTC